MVPRHLRFAVAVVVLAVGLTTSSIAADESFKVIVNPHNPVTTIDREFLRYAYLKKTSEWNDGSSIRPIDLSKRFPARDRFTQDVIRKTPSQLKSYWNQQIFSGKGVPPPETDSIANVIEYVLANPGAIGYLPATADPGRAKIVKVN